MSEATSHLLEGLTEAQRRAVDHLDGPLLVLAGPGSGKTTVVTRRVAWLVHQGIPPWQILALTFTNKAAAEMRQRVEALLPEGNGTPTVSTFHAFCARLMRQRAEAAGLSPRFSIYDSDDQRGAIKKAMQRAELSSRNWSASGVASAISNAKNKLQDAAAYAAGAQDFYHRSMARAYTAYEKILRENDALDFDDLLLCTAKMLRTNEAVRQELQSRYQYLLIDEYQDTNHAQFVIADALASAHKNICVVGDPDQSIYGWRGADIGNILEFEEQYPNAEIVPLGQNFRSTGHIVAAAAGLIAHNRRRKHKELSTELGAGERPTVILCRDEHHEATHIVDSFRRRHEDGVPWKEMAVLYRVNALSRVIEEKFRDAQIPYVIARGTAFYARKEVKDALAYLRLIVNPNDDIALGRVINDPPRGIGKTSWARVEEHAGRFGRRMGEVIRQPAAVEGLNARAVAAIGKFAATVEGWRHFAQNEPGLGLPELVERVVRESGLEKHYASSPAEEDKQRVANLEELISAAAEFNPPAPDPPDAPRTAVDDLGAYLESVALVSDADAIDPAIGAVTLMTLHTAKGLEFEVVATAGLEMGLLPHGRAAESHAEMEEERRLCFVGMTRAKRHLMLTRASVRTLRGIAERTIASPFLEEIPADRIETEDLGGYDDRRPMSDWDHQTGGESESTLGDYEVGCRVRHPRFGLGRIEALSPRPRGAAARVDFDAVGVKTLILEYAKLTRVD